MISDETHNPDGVELMDTPIEITPEGREIMREFFIKSIAMAMFEKYGRREAGREAVQSAGNP